jgi:uncharacterized protein with gpF-like domain
MPEAEWGGMTFEQALKFLRDKLNMPTATWDELWKEAHSRAFTVAGAMEEDLLNDLRAAVDKSLADGTTLDQFRKDFSKTVEKHGWNYKGGFGWRTATIFNTNLSTSYSAGRWKQQTDPDTLRVRPYLRYVPSSSASPRAEHMAWYNTVLPADDPFWDDHYPPNGWGCKCGAVSVSGRELEKLQDKFAQTQFAIRTEAPPVETYEWTNPRTGEVHQVPVGIDPGWDYNPGQLEAAHKARSARGV